MTATSTVVSNRSVSRIRLALVDEIDLKKGGELIGFGIVACGNDGINAGDYVFEAARVPQVR